MPPIALKNNLPGRQKAAVLMLALSPPHSAKLLGLLHEDEIRDISSAMAMLGTVRADVVEQLCTEFADGIGSQGNVLGSFEATELLLQQALPKDRAHQIMEEIRGPAGRTMWDKLGNVNEAVLANYLKNEYPQTVAVVLSKLKADHAGRVLTLLPDGFSIEVVMRMLRMESVQREILDGVEQTLRTEFMTNLARTSRRDSHEMMAEIFNSLDRQSEARFFQLSKNATRRQPSESNHSCSRSMICVVSRRSTCRFFFALSKKINCRSHLKALPSRSSSFSSAISQSGPDGCCVTTSTLWALSSSATSTRRKASSSTRRRSCQLRASST